MNKEMKDFALKKRESMFNFGRRQAYSALSLSMFAALVVLFLIGWVVIKGVMSWPIGIFFIVFYAVTQGGPSGFAKIIDMVKRPVSKDQAGKENES